MKKYLKIISFVFVLNFILMINNEVKALSEVDVNESDYSVCEYKIMDNLLNDSNVFNITGMKYVASFKLYFTKDDFKLVGYKQFAVSGGEEKTKVELNFVDEQWSEANIETLSTKKVCENLAATVRQYWIDPVNLKIISHPLYLDSYDIGHYLYGLKYNIYLEVDRRNAEPGPYAFGFVPTEFGITRYDKNLPIMYCQNIGDDVCNPTQAQLNASCYSYDPYYKSIEANYSMYGSTKNTIYLENASRDINSINQVCNSIIRNNDYNSVCTKKCLNMNEDIFELKKKYNIDSNSNTGNRCGFSQRIIDWVLNLLKWVRYIVPILVIILSSIDFVKAILADKQEEIKKAGEHFVKRLIVAALIFIVPFVLEFILGIFGYSANNFCL